MYSGMMNLGLAVLAMSTAANAIPHKWGLRGFDGWGPIRLPGSCNCGRANLPTPASGYGANFTAPETTFEVVAVVIGWGTQNYTCESESAVPKPNGAKAELYDASCIAFDKNLLDSLPGEVLQAGGPGPITGKGKNRWVKLNKLGSHIFPDATTPVFNFNVPNRKFVGKKKEGTPAPASAAPGQYGAVDWLNLDTKEGTRGFTRAYRVVTAGGKPPTTCAGKGKSFEMPYATQYWFYNTA